MLAWTRPFFLLSSCLVLLLSGALLVQAQIHGVPASVTSFGFGGSTSPTPGVAASVTSLGPNGFGNRPAIFGNCCLNSFRTNQNPPLFRHRGRGHHTFFPAGVPTYSLPYTPVIIVQSSDAAYAEDDEDYGGPTIFDRRGTRDSQPRKRYVEPEPERRLDPPAAAPARPEEPVAAQPNTVLLFKDGRKAEVLNYAIVGDTLFELSEGRTHKIQLADLDLPATHKVNEERGVDFQVPVGSQTPRRD